MKTSVLATITSTELSTQLLLDENVRESARELVVNARDRRVTGFMLKFDDGSVAEMPDVLTDPLRHVILNLVQGDVTLRAMPDELTTTTAASLLGVSRPTLMKLIESKELPATKVGSHHRLRAQDVLALRDKREKARRAAFDELREMELELND